ncbi:MAG: ECF transporter S component [Candidatus Bathyarchaeia archaeon]
MNILRVGLLLRCSEGKFGSESFTRLGGVSDTFASVLALFNIMVPFVYGYEAYQIFAVGTVLGVCLVAAGVELASSILGVKWRGPLLTSREVAVVAVLSAVYAVLIIMLKVPSPTGGYTHVGDLVVFAAALLFGYKVGGLVGIVGSVAADFYVGYERWFVSILAHSLEGLIPGFAKGKSLVVQAVACIVGYPVALVSYIRDLFVQAGISIVVGLAVVKAIRSTIPQLR